MQVIADHARATTFLIADGVTPSNEWRGYVLRRIMRRAMRHGRLLGLTEPFLWRTVDWVVGLMRDTYPELETERRRVEETVRAEEERFAETLDTGMRLIEEYDAGHRRPGARGGGGRRGRDDPRPHARVRGVGRSGRRHRHDRRARRPRPAPRHLLPRLEAHRPPRARRAGRLPRERGRRGERRDVAATGAAPAPHGHAPATRCAPPCPRHPRGAGGLARRSRSSAVRLLPRRPGEGPRGRADRGAGERAGPGQHPGGPDGDGPRRGAPDGRPGPLRREIR